MKSHLKQLALFTFAMFVAQSAQHLGKAVHPTSPVPKESFFDKTWRLTEVELVK